MKTVLLSSPKLNTLFLYKLYSKSSPLEPSCQVLGSQFNLKPFIFILPIFPHACVNPIVPGTET